MTTQPNAVYFAPHDYAPVTRRFGAFLVDLVALYLLAVVLAIPIGYLLLPRGLPSTPDTPPPQVLSKYTKIVFTLGGLLGGVPYHIALRRSRGGTLGYRLLGIRLVDQTGHPPSWRVLGKRFVLAVILAIPCLFFLPLVASYLYALKHPRRQTGHDFWSGTWLVRKNARPAGPALTAYNSKLLGTLLLNYIDVEPYVPEHPPTTNEATTPEPDPTPAASPPA
jgi:uncharacterized RDD family membrane protein YckC